MGRVIVLVWMIAGCHSLFGLDSVDDPSMRPDGGNDGSGGGDGGHGWDGGGSQGTSSCDPLADNDFDGTGVALTKSGTACGAGQGCYGVPYGSAPGTVWSCDDDTHPSLRHRSVPASPATVTSCSQGYIPLLREMTGSTAMICAALCKPGNTYAGNPSTQYPAGKAPHRCNATDRRGTFNETATGEHCAFSWRYEKTNQNTVLLSPTGDTVGICLDHSKYKWDSNGDGSLTAADAAMPPCATLPLTASPGQLTAGDLGCVESALSGVPVASLTPRFDDTMRIPWPRSPHPSKPGAR